MFEASRDSHGHLWDLPCVIGRGSSWALMWLGQMWVNFERTRNDLCLTAKTYSMGRSYFGVVRPGEANNYCNCGLGLRAQLCNHEFGECISGSTRHDDVQ